jgi:Domain of unknown function (DUF4342)
MNEEPGATRRMDPSEVPGSSPSNGSSAAGGPAAGRSQEFQLTGDSVIAKIQELVHEGNVRRIVIKHPDGHTIVEFPLTVGVVGAVLMPVWAALGAIVALAADLTIVVEQRE